MLTEAIFDSFNREIRFTRERWDYIVSKRPIMSEYKKQFIDTIKEPELIKTSVYDPEVVLYYKHFKNILGGKYMVTVIKMDTDRFVLTGYVSDRIKEGEVIWRKD
jgi:hypothetical protein